MSLTFGDLDLAALSPHGGGWSANGTAGAAMVSRVSVLAGAAGSGLWEQCGEVRPGVDPLGQEVTVFVEEAFARGVAAECLVEALRFDVGRDHADVEGLDTHGVKPGGELLEQLSPEAVTLMIGVDVQRPHLTGGASRVVRGDGCRGDRDQGSGGVFGDQVTRLRAARVGVTFAEVPLPAGG